MFNRLLTLIFGSRNDRLVAQLRKSVANINALEPGFEALSDEELKAKTAEYRQRLADGATIDALLPEAFAAVREASRRALGLRRPLPPCARPRAAPWACASTTCS